MKATQKLKLTIEDLTIETTYANLPEKVKFLADKLEKSSDPLAQPVFDTIVTSGNAALFVQVAWVGKPKQRPAKILGYDADELMGKQYK